jgi:hypothetical protein
MMKQLVARLLSLFVFAAISFNAIAQDTLPRFTLEDKGNGRIIISWRNPYPNLIQLAVQRSYDSLKRFSTVYSSTSPELPVNGFSDKIVPGLKPYYRIFYVMQGGAYYFTKSKRIDAAIVSTGNNVGSSGTTTTVDSRRDQMNEETVDALKGKKTDSVAYPPDKQFFIKIADSLYATLITREMLHFRDSILANTKDTLYQLNEDTILLGIYVPPYIQKTSEFVFTDKDGYVVIKLADTDKKRYDVLFMEEDETPVLELKAIKEPFLIIDKTNFYHGGWFKFELKENGRVKERNKVFLAKDFSP